MVCILHEHMIHAHESFVISCVCVIFFFHDADKQYRALVPCCPEIAMLYESGDRGTDGLLGRFFCATLLRRFVAHVIVHHTNEANVGSAPYMAFGF